MTQNLKRPLTPARPDTPESAAYKPRLPWRWLILGATLITTVVVGFRMKEQSKADTLRAQILAVHEQQLGPARARYAAFRKKIETWVSEAAAAEPTLYVHPQLKLAGLRSGRGLYLRVPRAAAGQPQELATAASAMEADAITKCLGLSAASARGLFEQGAFLTEAWAKDTRQETDVMQLRVTDEVLARHIEADLPSVLALLRSQWFMLVLETGDNRRDAPVDVFLWDLTSETQLLRARIQSRGAYLRTRIAGAPRAGVAGGTATGAGAHDCSIAAQLRALQGAPPTEVRNLEPNAVSAQPAR